MKTVADFKGSLEALMDDAEQAGIPLPVLLDPLTRNFVVTAIALGITRDGFVELAGKCFDIVKKMQLKASS